MRKSFDYSVLILTVTLVLFGVVMVYSASFYYASNSPEANYDGLFYFKKQVIGAIIGGACMAFFMFFDYRKLAKFEYIGIAISLVLLVIVFIPGVGKNLNGSSRWIQLPVIGGFQPVEVAKFAIIIFMAANISRKHEKMGTFKYGILPYLIVTGVFCLLLLLQPNMSATVCIALLAVVLMLVGGARLYQLGIIGAAGIAGGSVLLFTQAYRIDRLKAFQDPWKYPSDEGYQLIQSLYSLGSAGLFGRGLGNSRQKLLFLPYRESDFIFSIICEELGLLGALVLIALFALLFWRGIKIAFRAPDTFGMLCATGIVAIIAIQVIVNIAVVTGSIPPTGVALPFISAGSSSLVIFMSSIGVLLNISSQSNAA